MAGSELADWWGLVKSMLAGVLQELSVLSWRVGAVQSLNYGLLLQWCLVSERDLMVTSDN